MGGSFHDQLVAARDKKHSKDHPFLELWARGKLTQEQTALYCTQHYHYVGEYLNWLAYEASQIPKRDVKVYLFENLGDEENPDDRHLDIAGVSSSNRVTASTLSNAAITTNRACSFCTGLASPFNLRTDASVLSATIRRSHISRARLSNSTCPG